jgi:hypothetical protein
MLSSYPEVHSSEWAWISSGEDYVIHNDGTILDLAVNLRKVIDRIRPKTYNSNVDKPEGVLL